MKLATIIGIADKAYPDGLVKQAFTTKKPAGDGLAEFIVRELKDTYDPKASSLAQLEEAARVMDKARRELVDVAEVLEVYYNVEIRQRKTRIANRKVKS